MALSMRELHVITYVVTDMYDVVCILPSGSNIEAGMWADTKGEHDFLPNVCLSLSKSDDLMTWA